MRLPQITLFALLLGLFISGCSSRPDSPSLSKDSAIKLVSARYGHAAISDEKRIYVFAGAGHQGFLADVEIIDPQTGQVEQLKNKLIPRRFLSAAWDGNESIYLLGGVSYTNRRHRLERRIEVFNTRTHQIEIIQAPHPLPRTATAVFWQQKLIIIGGAIPHQEELRHVPWTLIYDVEQKRWQKVQDMPLAMSTKAALYQDKIYLAGGYDGDNSLASFFAYDLIAESWQPLDDLPFAISANSAVVDSGKLYLFGNYAQLDACYEYDFDARQWQSLNIDYQPSRHNTAVRFRGSLYIIGGNTTSANASALDTIQIFRL